MADTQQADTPDKKGRVLKALALERFRNMTPAEIKLLLAAPRGEYAYCGPSRDDKDPENDPSYAEKSWSSLREIRAELLRWLVIDGEAARCIDPHGIRLHAAKITGALDLSDASLSFPLMLLRCSLSDTTYLYGAKIPKLSLDGSRIRSLLADGFRAESTVFLRQTFVVDGEVSLTGAQIGGDLDFSGATFNGPLTAYRIIVKGGVFLNDTFAAYGVHLTGANIAGDLNCNNATLKNSGGNALTAEGIEVEGEVFFSGKFSAEGGVSLTGAHIGGDLDCESATFNNAGGNALSATGSVVKGLIFLNHGFRADGAVVLIGAQIDGLDCSAGTFKNPQGSAISAGRIIVKGGVFLNDKFVAEGDVDLISAQIGADVDCDTATFKTLMVSQARIAGTFWWTRISNAQSTTLDLRAASVTVLTDDESSWPAAGNLLIDGFTYQRIQNGSTTAGDRLRWIGLQGRFASQPYRQLAKVLTDLGDQDGARRVLFEMERARRRSAVESTVFAKASDSLLEASIGYGYYPQRAIWPLLGLTALGWILYRRSYLAGTMAPTEKEAYEFFKEHDEPPPHYRRFHPLVYSVENCIPLVHLGQADRWAPDPVSQPAERLAVKGTGRLVWLRAAWRGAVSAIDYLAEWPAFLQIFVWIQILLGWILATLFVAGVTGLVH
jgi:hypothetical protein